MKASTEKSLTLQKYWLTRSFIVSVSRTTSFVIELSLNFIWISLYCRSLSNQTWCSKSSTWLKPSVTSVPLLLNLQLFCFEPKWPKQAFNMESHYWTKEKNTLNLSSGFNQESGSWKKSKASLLPKYQIFSQELLESYLEHVFWHPMKNQLF